MFTDSERHAYFESLHLSQQQIALLERTIVESPARKVGKGALKNSIMAFHSRINGGVRRDLESVTVEGLHALELELSPDVHEYFTQVQIFGVERLIDGKRYVGSAKLDKLVFATGKITFVECKDLDTVQKAHAKRPYDWREENGAWTHVAYEAWANEHGFEFELWVSPGIPGVSLANHLLLYGLKDESFVPSEERIASTLKRYLERGPRTIAEAIAAVDGANARIVSKLLAAKEIHGTIRSRPLNNPENFVLCVDYARAAEIDDRLLKQLESGFKEPVVTNPALRASTTDYDRGKQRLDRVEKMLAGKEPITRRYRPLVRAVQKARSEGSSSLAPCITNFANCGSADPKLDPQQIAMMEEVFKDYWDTGIHKIKSDLHNRLAKVATERGIVAPCEATMHRYLNLRSSMRHLLNTGGRKMLHAHEDPTDPSKCTIPALAPGLFMHVDSTKFDHRSSPIAPDLIRALPFECPTLYVGVDSCTTKPLGRALVFGPQSRDGLAILMRDILTRQFRLPWYLLADGGSEIVGAWFADFCLKTGMSRMKPPTGDPAKNSPAENTLGRVNVLLSQRLIGSTEPDKAGRRVDNRYKSYATACLLFKDIVAEIDEVLFGDIATTPTSNKIGSPEEKSQVLSEAFGPVGINRAYDDEFRILTSPIIKQDISAIGTTGYKHEERTYRSTRLSELLRTKLADEKRRDCVDPTLMYFKFGSEWIKAHSRDWQELRTCSELDLLYRSLTGREVRSTNRCIRKEKAKTRMDRVDRANAAAPATAHLPPEEGSKTSTPDVKKRFAIEDMGTIEPFPEEDEEGEEDA